MKSKIHLATVTDLQLYYQGSIGICKDLIKAARLFPGEKVQVLNFNNSQRFETYVIEGKRGSKIFGLNGPAARRGELNDQIFIISYALIDPQKEIIKPTIIDLKSREKK